MRRETIINYPLSCAAQPQKLQDPFKEKGGVEIKHSDSVAHNPRISPDR